MINNQVVSTSRRSFLKGTTSALAGLLIPVHVVVGVEDALAQGAPNLSPPANPNAFVHVGLDDRVTVLVKFLDKGQGIATAMATLVAEEMDADWSQMLAQFAPGDVTKYANLLYGVQGTGSSTSVRGSYLQMRKAGAAAREMLLAAAANEWKVPVAELTISSGLIGHLPSGRKSGFGHFATAAAALPVPSEPTLKKIPDFKIIGRDKLPRLDTVMKTTGQPIFGHDLRPAGMLYASLARSPRFGGVVATFDATKARKVEGVVDVISIGRGVAVLARNSWAAIKGRAALDIVWDESRAEKRGTPELVAEYKRLAGEPGLVAKNVGDAPSAVKGAARRIEADYVFPYLAHAPMEPENVVIELTEKGAKLTLGSQFQTVEQMAAAGVLGVKPADIELTTTWAGASFGRRANPAADFVVEAALIAKAYGRQGQPIQLLFTREDDIRGGYYRPMAVHRISAGLDAQGRVTGWHQRVVCQAITTGTPFANRLIKDGVEALTVEGAADTAYSFPEFRVETTQPNVGVPVLWWRSVGHSHCIHAVESFVDELAAAAGQDPLAFRQGLLVGKQRHLAVLNAAAQKIGWGRKLPAGHGLGIAVQSCYGSFVSHAAEVVVKDGALSVVRLVCAIDCGVAVNPDVIRAQAEGGAIFALGAALKGKITLTEGKVDQSNFDSYEVARMSDAPPVDVVIIASSEAPGGVGEPVVPSVAPAIANAIYAATGKRLRNLPYDLEALRKR